MFRRLVLLSSAVLLSLGLLAQPRIGFTNLNGFPSIISNGTGYNLSGYILNTGTDTLFTGVDIMMAVGNGPAIPIQNNVSLVSPLAPGDSVFWSKGGHSFPGGQFAPGNNDVVVWPTRLQGPANSVESDSLHKDIFYAQDAAFGLFKSLSGVGMAFFVNQTYNLGLFAKNVGGKKNNNELCAYVSYNGGSPVLIGVDQNKYQQGEDLQLAIMNFSPIATFPDILNALSPGYLTFWVEEKNGLPPVNALQYPILQMTKLTHSKVELKIEVYPNPARDQLSIGYGGMDQDNVSGVQVYEITGRLLREYAGAVSQISLQGLSTGRYYLRIQTADGARTLPFVKE